MRIFLSYSRRETAIADRMVADLEARGFEVDIDRRDLPYGEEWQAELVKFIHASDTIVWLASEASVASSWVKWELGEVQRLNKRLLPVRVGPLLPENLPEALGRIHVLPAEGVYDPAIHLETLIAAIETDRTWMQTHTRLGDRAAEWIARGRSSDRLLRGRALRDAEEWRDSRPDRAPAPSSDTLDLLLQSRRASTRGLRTLVALAAIGFVAMTGLAGYAVLQAGEAQRQTGIAQDQESAARINERSAFSALGEVALRNNDPQTAMKILLAAWPRNEEERTPQYEAVLSNLSLATSLAQPIFELSYDGELADGGVISPDGHAVLSWSADGRMRLVDAQTGAQIGALMRHDDWVTGAVFYGGGKRILSWSQDGTLRHWDASTGEQISAEKTDVASAELSKDERRILSATYEGEVILWDIASGERVRTMYHASNASGAVFDKAEKRALSWSIDGVVRLWDLETSFQIGPDMRHDDMVGGAIFSEDETRIVSWSNDGTVRLWNVATGAAIGAPMRHEGWVSGAWFDEQRHRIVSWSEDDTVRMWDSNTARPVGEVMRHEGSVNGALLISGGRELLTWGGDGAIRTWDAESGRASGAALLHDVNVFGVTLNRTETRMLSWSQEGVIKLWDMKSRIQLGGDFQHDYNIAGVQFDAGETRALSWGGVRVKLWRLDVGYPSDSAIVHNGINGATYSPDGSRIASWSRDGTTRLWSSTDGSQTGTLMGHTAAVNGALFLRGGVSLLTWSDDGSLLVWDTASAQRTGEPMHHNAGVLGARLNAAADRILSWSADGTARLWDTRSHTPIGTPMHHTGSVLGAAFGPRGETILTWAEDGRARVWGRNGQLRSVFQHETLTGASFSDDGKYVLTWSADGVVKPWNVANISTAGPPKTFETFFRPGILGATFSSDGSRALAWSNDHVVLWDVETGRDLWPPATTNYWGDLGFAGAAFASGGTQILMWSGDNYLHFVDADTGTLVGRSMRQDASVTGSVRAGSGRLVSWSDTGTVKVWDEASRSQLGPTFDAGDGLAGIALRPDHDEVLTWRTDGRMRQWRIDWPSGDILELACALLPKPGGQVDMVDVETRYGITITDPICTPDQLGVGIDWSVVRPMVDTAQFMNSTVVNG